MRRSLVVLVAALGCAPAAPTSLREADKARVVAEALAATESLFVAIEARDSARALALFAEDSGVRLIEGGSYTRREIAAFAGDLYRSMRSIESGLDGTPDVSVLSRDAAVVSGRYRDVLTDTTGKRTEVRGAGTWVLVRRQGRWVMQHVHATPDPAPPN